MELYELRPAPGSKKKAFRKGRGTGSGNGKTAGYGSKGQKARTGSPRPGFEGGQMPLYRRLPKRGFTNRNRIEYAVIDLDTLSRFEEGSTVDQDALLKEKLVKDIKDGIKVLGDGKLTKKLTVKLKAFSESARKQIEDAGGSCEVV